MRPRTFDFAVNLTVCVKQDFNNKDTELVVNHLSLCNILLSYRRRYKL